nr:exonuclease domain-containing protein [uncultured Marinifilum sp.]
MSKENYLYALHFHKLGLNATCISNELTEHNFYNKNILKVPCHKWKDLRTRRQSIDELKKYPWTDSTGVGIVAGFKNIHVLDLDGCTNYSIVEEILSYLELPADYEWVIQSGSLCGYHIYFYSDKIDVQEDDDVVSSYATKQEYEHLFDKIELLWSTHAVLPPSLHNTGNKYEFVNCRIPSETPLEIDISNFNKIKEKYLDRVKEVIKKSYFEEWVATESVNQPSSHDTINLSELKGKLSMVLDIETDGLISTQMNQKVFPSIIQIAWLIMDEEGIVYKKVSELLNSNFNPNSKAFEINKIDPEKLKQIGKDSKTVLKEFRNDLKHCDFVVAHNIEFDIPVLANELSNYYIENDLNSKIKICTMRKSLPLFRTDFDSNPKFPKLDELFYKLFNYQVVQQHNAQSDVLLTSKCFKQLRKRKLINIA